VGEVQDLGPDLHRETFMLSHPRATSPIDFSIHALEILTWEGYDCPHSNSLCVQRRTEKQWVLFLTSLVWRGLGVNPTPSQPNMETLSLSHIREYVLSTNRGGQILECTFLHFLLSKLFKWIMGYWQIAWKVAIAETKCLGCIHQKVIIIECIHFKYSISAMATFS
jgi:hypothetical protein